MSKSVLDTVREYTQDPQRRQDVETHDLELELCDRMIELREKAGLTQEALANIIGCTQGYIAKLENGAYDRCGIGTLRKFALALGNDINLEGLFKPVNSEALISYPSNFQVFFSSFFDCPKYELTSFVLPWEELPKPAMELNCEQELAA